MRAVPAGQFRIAQLVGELHWQDYLIKANPGAPRLEAATDYVLVLRWSEVLRSYLVSADGIYAISAGSVEFLAEVRHAAFNR